MAVDIITNVLAVEVPTLPPSARVPTVGNQIHADILSISLFVDSMPILGKTLATSVSDHNCFAPKPDSSHQQDSNTSRVTSTTGWVPVTPINVEHLDDAPILRFANFVVDGFTKGFSTGFIGPVPNNTKVHTLYSASHKPAIVKEKIRAEIAAGRVLGPFSEPPFPNLVISPIGLVEKKLPGEYRLIHHLSYPDNKSINDGIPDKAASVQYTTVDDAIAVTRSLGVACFMAKTDIKKAFRLLPIREEEHHLLGFAFLEHYYVDMRLPMGIKSSCRLF